MDIIQSYWALPGISKSECNYSRFAGGWLQEKYHAISWAYSFSLLRQYNAESKIRLYTDKEGFDWLINKLALPYTDVHVELDKLNNYNPLLWALAKIYAYQQQHAPFIHVDGDVFIWQSLSQLIKDKPLVAQNLEVDHEVYGKLVEEAGSIMKFVPEALSNIHSNDWITAINAGVLGGTDIPFIQKYCAEAFRFVEMNQDEIRCSKMGGAYNMYFEQLLFARMAADQYGSFDCIKTLVSNDEGNLHNLIRFGLVPQVCKYMHMIGVAKAMPALSVHLEERLAFEFPQVSKHINSIYKEAKWYFPLQLVQYGDHQKVCYRSSNIATGNIDGCRQWLSSFCGIRVDTLEQIEDVLAENFDAPFYHELSDIYQLESANLACQELASPPGIAEWQHLYELKMDEFFNLTFTLNPNVCRIVHLYFDWEVAFNIDGNNWCAWRIDDKETTTKQTKLKSWLLTQSHEGLQLLKLTNWFKIIEMLDEQPMTGREIIDTLQGQENGGVKGDFVNQDIYYFLTSQLFVHKRIQVADKVTAVR
jgi:hypothetical protein